MIEILLVEDDDGDIYMLQEVIQKARFQSQIHVVYNGEEGLKFLQDPEKPKVDFIITDLNMPRMDGHEFLSELTKDSALKSIPVAVLTNSHDIDDFMKSHNLNAISCVLKPLNETKVTEIVKAVEQFWLGTPSVPMY